MMVIANRFEVRQHRRFPRALQPLNTHRSVVAAGVHARHQPRAAAFHEALGTYQEVGCFLIEHFTSGRVGKVGLHDAHFGVLDAAFDFGNA